MKTSLVSLVALVTTLAWAAPAHADKPGTFGIGIGAGTATNGLSGKYYMGSFAIQANLGLYGVGADRFGNNGFAVSVDGLLEQSALFKNGVVSIDWNLGLGGGLALSDDNFLLAAAGVIGLEFNFVPVPIDFVVEYRPTLVITGLDLNPIDFTGHLRFYF